MKSVFLLELYDYGEVSILGCYSTLAAANLAKSRRDSRTLHFPYNKSFYFPETDKKFPINVTFLLNSDCYMIPEWLEYDFSETSRIHVREVKVLGTTCN